MQETAATGVLPAAEAPAAPPAKVAVWDPFVRLFHWSLVAAVAIALVTSLMLPPTWITLHVISGTSAVALVAARIVWGFLGPAYARFDSFIRHPREVLRHLDLLRRDAAAHHLGHNPAGGAMIVALFAAVVVIALTGTISLGGSLKSGPLAFMTSFAAGEAARVLHELLAYGLIVLVVLHVGGVVFESRRGGENLAVAMIDGRKSDRWRAIALRPRAARPLAAVAIVTLVFLATGALVVGLASRPALGVPTAVLDPTYVEECGACHKPFHPSLAPAATWLAVMDGLASHFGEDASLDPATAGKIRDWLLANAAETADTRAANRLQRRDAADPLAITATPFWRRAHASISDSVFAAKAIGARSNCGACHQDALAGLFNPSAIAMPKEAAP